MSDVDWLVVLSEDIGYVSQSVIVGDLEILWHPFEPRIVGIKIWSMNLRPNGPEILSRAGLRYSPEDPRSNPTYRPAKPHREAR